MKFKALPFIIFLLLFSCKPPDPSNPGGSKPKKGYKYDETSFIKLKKDPCFGFCPVYEVTISGSGNAVYNGIRNVEKEGTWYRELSAKQTNELFKAFEAADYWSFQDEYTAQVTDLPTTWTTLSIGEQTKTIKDYYGAPDALKKLEEMVAQLAEEEEGWKHEAGIQ